MTMEKKHRQLKNLIAVSLFLGVLIGFIGNTFFKGTLLTATWGLNAFFILIGTSVLSIKLTKLDHDIPAAGFVILSIGNAMSYGFLATHDAGADQLGASVFIYVPGMLLISLSDILPNVFRILGFISAIAFSILAYTIFVNVQTSTTQAIFVNIGYIGMNITEAAWAWWVFKNKI